MEVIVEKREDGWYWRIAGMENLMPGGMGPFETKKAALEAAPK